MHRQVSRPLLIVSAFLAFVALGCSSSHKADTTPSTTVAPTTSTTSTIALPTVGASSARGTAGIHGTLNIVDGCVRIGSTAIVWPHGYQLASDPLRVVDDQGHDVARVGQVVTLNGSPAPSNMNADQLVAAYPPLRSCLPQMRCHVHPTPLGCFSDVWIA